MPAKRTRSVTVIALLAVAWVWTASTLADTAPAGQPHVAAPQPDIFQTLLSGSGNTAMLAVLLWMKLTSQDRDIAELKALLKSRPCVLEDAEQCEVHGNGRRKK